MKVPIYKILMHFVRFVTVLLAKNEMNAHGRFLKKNKRKVQGLKMKILA